MLKSTKSRQGGGDQKPKPKWRANLVSNKITASKSRDYRDGARGMKIPGGGVPRFGLGIDAEVRRGLGGWK